MTVPTGSTVGDTLAHQHAWEMLNTHPPFAVWSAWGEGCASGKRGRGQQLPLHPSPHIADPPSSHPLGQLDRLRECLRPNCPPERGRAELQRHRAGWVLRAAHKLRLADKCAVRQLVEVRHGGVGRGHMERRKWLHDPNFPSGLRIQCMPRQVFLSPMNAHRATKRCGDCRHHHAAVSAEVHLCGLKTRSRPACPQGLLSDLRTAILWTPPQRTITCRPSSMPA